MLARDLAREIIAMALQQFLEREHRLRPHIRGGARQAGKACAAAWTAASTSVAVDSGTRPMRRAVAGLVTSSHSVVRAATQEPAT